MTGEIRGRGRPRKTESTTPGREHIPLKLSKCMMVFLRCSSGFCFYQLSLLFSY